LIVCSQKEELQISHESKYRKFTKEFRESALRRFAETANVSELCRELGISRQLLYLWRESQQSEEQRHFEATDQRLRQEFVYLAVVLDAFSRKVVGWALDRTLTTRLPLLALERAIALRQPTAGLVHHSDRGVQYRGPRRQVFVAGVEYASEQYTPMLHNHGILPSISRPANPYDNAFCESFMKTLKREEIYANKYQDIDELGANPEEFIEHYYNRQRLHSALGYNTPQQFEATCSTHTASAGPTVSFPRHGEIYRFGKWRRGRPRKASGETVLPSSPAHPINESPVGYSLTGWSPPEPVSASPTEAQSAGEPTK
jgi:transposase InsO family protein